MHALSKQRMIIAESVPREFTRVVDDRHLRHWFAIVRKLTSEIQIDAAHCIPSLQKAMHRLNGFACFRKQLRLAFTINPQHRLLIPVWWQQINGRQFFTVGQQFQLACKLDKPISCDLVRLFELCGARLRQAATDHDVKSPANDISKSLHTCGVVRN